MGCVTDRGLGDEGLLRRCGRAAAAASRAGVLSIAQRCPLLRELVLSGIVGLTMIGKDKC